MTVNKIKLFKNKVIKNNKGNLIKYISKKNFFFKKFGEVYFNYIKYKKQKGWIKHKKNSCLIQCVHGKTLFHLIDNKNKEKKLVLKSGEGEVLKIPAGIWFSFISLSKESIIANLIENPHDDNEVTKSNKIKNYKVL
tara:strand:- start:3520 stop:3930 length:411 start_codon:yes stop_codon:yes gene_type:complete